MKKLLLSILVLVSVSASAQVSLKADTTKPVKKAIVTTIVNGNTILERVNLAVEMYGTQVERSAEVKFRNAKVAELKKDGYAFDGMVLGQSGKFMKFVK